MSMIEIMLKIKFLVMGPTNQKLRRVASMITHERVLAGRNFHWNSWQGGSKVARTL
jgi:hypothetical protein